MTDLEKNHPLAYTSDAIKECIWHDHEGVEDRFGRHPFAPYPKPTPKIVDNVLEAIGRTPLVRLNKIPLENGVKCNVYGKCEFLNAGGSVKDRIALRMIELAEESGRLKPGMTIVEPSSGNMGIGLALAAAVKGYRCVILMKEHMSQEKECIIRALGAEVIRIRDDASFDSDDSQMAMAFKTQKSIPNSVLLDQYLNCGNPMTHYESTAEEILEALDQRVDMVVVGAGTGGSAIGISRKIKQRCPECKVIGVDPVGSKLAQSDAKGAGFMVEGIGHDFRPKFLDLALVDKWEIIEDADGFNMARKLHRMEGILCGGSSGSILVGAMRAARELPPDANCVFLLPDGILRYMTQFVNDEWMRTKGYFKEKTPLYGDLSLEIESKDLAMGQQMLCKTFAEMELELQSANFSQQEVSDKRPLLASNIFGIIGHTPMLRLQKIPQTEQVDAEILLKLEYLNPGNSWGDRVAQHLITQAEQKGLLEKNCTIIAPSIDGGNMGIGLAMIAASKSFRCVIVVPAGMSREQEVVLNALGAVVVRIKEIKSANGVCARIQQAIPNSVVFDQQAINQASITAHYSSTGAEILHHCDKIDAVAIGVTPSAFGPIIGISKRIKEEFPQCKVIGVSPKSFEETTGTNSSVQFSSKLVDEWMCGNIDQEEIFQMARRIMSENGIFGGPLSALAFCASLKYAKEHHFQKGQRIVAILPDGFRSSVSKITGKELWPTSKSVTDYCSIQ